jgi:ferric-dicitrate binding protein FerR (iron transport regulator)
MDPGVLTSFLAPFLPYLMSAGQELIEEARRKFGTEAWEQATRIWTKLRPKIEEREAAKEAVVDVAERPDDPRAIGSLELQVEKLLASDPILATELAQIWSRGPTRIATAAGKRSVAIAGDVSDSTITTGDRGPNTA